MPDPTFKIDGATVLSKSGTTVSIDSGLNIKPAFSALDSSATNGPTSGTATTKSTILPIFACRAWVNFDGTSVDGSNNCAIRASGNISNVVRNGTGDYTIYFEIDMPDTNYCAVPGSGGTIDYDITTDNYAVGSIKLYGSLSQTEAGPRNITYINLAIFR